MKRASSRCFDINVPTAARSSAVGEDSGTAGFAGIFDGHLEDHRDMPMAVGVIGSSAAASLPIGTATR